MDEQNLVFLSYASPDLVRVTEFYDFLTNRGFNVWFDKRRLKGGQNWGFEIKRALAKAEIVVVFLSENSVDRRGYAQREIKLAIDQSQEKLIDDVYLIPILLDEVAIPRQLKGIQALKASDNDCKAELVGSLEAQFQRLGQESARLQGEAKLRWSISNYRDCWDGLPGHDTSLQLLHFSSEMYPQASEITDVLKGWLLGQVMRERTVKFAQSSDAYSFGDSRTFRQNTWDASSAEPKIKERVISISYSVWLYAAMAAHPSQYFRTFSFTLDPITQIEHLEDIFEDRAAAFALIQTEARRELLSERREEGADGSQVYSLTEDYVNLGTSSWSDFDNFVFAEQAIELLFSTYQVAPYVFGPQVVSIPYEKVASLMRKHFALALGVEHLDAHKVCDPANA